MSNQNPRSSQRLALLALLDTETLKCLKVAIKRKNMTEIPNPPPIERSLEDPALLVIHFSEDEGQKPLFDRDDIVVNQPDDEERIVCISEEPRREELRSEELRSEEPQREESRREEPPREELRREEPRREESRREESRREESRREESRREESRWEEPRREEPRREEPRWQEWRREKSRSSSRDSKISASCKSRSKSPDKHEKGRNRERCKSKEKTSSVRPESPQNHSKDTENEKYLSKGDCSRLLDYLQTKRSSQSPITNNFDLHGVEEVNLPKKIEHPSRDEIKRFIHVNYVESHGQSKLHQISSRSRERKSRSRERRSRSREHNSRSHERKSRSHERKIRSRERKSRSRERKSRSRERRSRSRERKSRSRERPRRSHSRRSSRSREQRSRSRELHSRSPESFRKRKLSASPHRGTSDKLVSSRSPSHKYRSDKSRRSRSPVHRDRYNPPSPKQDIYRKYNRSPPHRQKGVFTKEDYERSKLKMEALSKGNNEPNHVKVRHDRSPQKSHPGPPTTPQYFYNGEDCWMPMPRTPFMPFGPNPFPRRFPGPPMMYPRVPLHSLFRPRLPIYNQPNRFKIQNVHPRPATVTSSPTENAISKSVALVIQEIASNGISDKKDVNNDQEATEDETSK